MYDFMPKCALHIIQVPKRINNRSGYRNEAADLADKAETLRWIRSHGSPQQVKEAEEWYAANARKIPQLMHHMNNPAQRQIVRSIGGMDGIPAKYAPGMTTLKDYDSDGNTGKK